LALRVLTDKLADGLFLRLPDREAGEAARLRGGETITCTLETGTRAPARSVALQVANEQYCEAGELDKIVMTEFNDPQSCVE
jgi:hypothetical protein